MPQYPSSQVEVPKPTASGEPAAPGSAAQHAAPSGGRAFWPRLAQSAPTILVLAALASVAVWGHMTQWKMPSLSSLLGRAAEKPADDWCSAHTVRESDCVVCRPQLLARPAHYRFCEKHGVPDCPLEHPDVAQLAEPPQVTADDLARAERALQAAPRSPNGPTCKRHERLIQLASAESYQKLQIGRDSVVPTKMAEVVTANGELDFDRTRYARVAARVGGSAWLVAKNVGDEVRPGDLLALVDAAEVGKARSAYVQALAQVDRQQKNVERLKRGGDAVEGQRLADAEAALEEAQLQRQAAHQALANLGLTLSEYELRESRPQALAARLAELGMPQAARQALPAETTTANLLPVLATLGGRVVERDVVAGQVVDPSKPLFIVADATRLRMVLKVSDEDARRVRMGQTVTFQASRATGPTTGPEAPEARGTVAWISPAVDEKTRTVEVRADVSNPADAEHPLGRLRAHTFGTGRIVLREEDQALVVPNEAIHWEGCCHVVFVYDKNFEQPRAPQVFHVRKVRLGARDGGRTEIIAGLASGERVATRNSGVLRSELLKNNLGDG